MGTGEGELIWRLEFFLFFDCGTNMRSYTFYFVFFFFLKNRMDFEIFLYKMSDFLLCQILWYLYFWPRLNLLILLLNPSNIRALTAAGPCSSAVSICRYYDHPTEKKNKCKHNCVSLKSKGYNWSNNGVRWY